MPPRKKAKTSAADASESTTGDNSAAQPKAKRVARKGRRGRLAGMLDILPRDVLYEVFSHLEARDLVNLSRASKALRAVMMSRKSAPCWRAALARMERIPEGVPCFLSEPAYANLLIFHYCHNCLKPNTKRIYWMSARYCAACLPAMSTPRPELAAIYDEVESELGRDAIRGALFKVECVDSVIRERGKGNLFIYHKRDVESFQRKWRALSDREEKAALVQRQQEIAEEAHKFSMELCGLKERRNMDVRSDKDERLDDIKSELCAAGWRAEVKFMESQGKLEELSRHRLVNKPVLLTDEEWEKIKDEVIAIVQPYREILRASKKRRALYAARLEYLYQAFWEYRKALEVFPRVDTLAEEAQPTARDLAYMPEVRKLVEVDPGESLDADTFKPLIPALVEKWTENRRKAFEEKWSRVAKKKRPSPTAADPMALAITSFHCQECDEPHPIRWPAVLSHACIPWRGGAKPVKDDYEYAVQECFYGQAFHREDNKMVFNKYLQQTRDIISLCREDPDVVTYEAMEACPVRLSCKQCAKPGRHEVFDWLAALRHEVQHHLSEKETLSHRWERVSAEEATRATALAEALHRKWVDEVAYGLSLGRLSCSWCEYRKKTYLDTMIQHVRFFHKIENPAKGVDFCLLADLRARGAPPVWIFSPTLADDLAVKSLIAEGKGFFAESA
ncbi:hypothetical protein OH77DRAFT_1589623 [Trametes cingulata]|nr:hypothetical protein OH77DRAFT_1589623 [Trametes cingulata]